MALSPDFVRTGYNKAMGIDSIDHLPNEQYAQQLYECLSGRMDASPAYRNALLDDPRLAQALESEYGPGTDTALSQLAAGPNPDHCRRFIDNPSTTVTGESLNEAMTHAMQAGQHQTVSLLLKRGANSDLLTQDQRKQVVKQTGDSSFLEDAAHFRSTQITQRTVDAEAIGRMGAKVAEGGADPTGLTAIADELGEGASEAQQYALHQKAGEHYQLAMQQQAGAAITNAAEHTRESQQNLQALYDDLNPEMDPGKNA